MRASIGLSSEVPRNTHMPFCPSAEELTGLLADALSTAERDALARHVEGCAACQEQLARLTGTFNTETWQRAEHPLQGSEAEEGMMRRLKRKPPWLESSLPKPGASPAGPLPHAGIPMPGAVGSELPTVPGYEILGEL